MDELLRSEIAAINRDFLTFSGLVGGVQTNPDDLLYTRGSGQGLKLYDQVELDPHAYAVLQKRKMAVIQLPWQVVPGGDSPIDAIAAEFATEQLNNLGMPQNEEANTLGLKGFDGVSLCLLDAILKGYSVAEVVWGQSNRAIVVDRVMPREQRRFGFAITDRGWELRLFTRQNTYSGEAVPPKKFIVHTFGDKDGNPYGSGLGSRLFWNVFFKRQNIQFWLIFADKFGSPIPIGEYPVGTDDKAKGVLLDALRSITQGSAVAIPQGMVIRLLEAVRSGNVSTYEELCRYQDEQISECVLGETGSTNQSGDGGSRARDEVGNQVRQEIVQADADLLCETLNRTLIYWMTRLNFPDAQVPILSRTVESEQMDNRAKRDKILFEMGIALTDEAIGRVYGADYERTMRAGGVFDLPQFMERKPDTVDIFSQRLRGQATPIVTDWLRIIQVLLDDSPTLADFQEKLERVFPDLPNDQLAQILTQAYGATQLAGYYEASGDAPRV